MLMAFGSQKGRGLLLPFFYKILIAFILYEWDAIQNVEERGYRMKRICDIE